MTHRWIAGFVVVAVLSVGAVAASFTGYLDPLADEVDNALQAPAGTWTARQNRGLRRADKLMARPAATVLDDLRVTRRVASALSGVAAASPAIDGALDGAVADLTGEVEFNRQAFADRIARWADSKITRKAQRKLAAAGRALVKAAAATRRTRAAKFLSKAQKKVGQAHRVLDRSGVADPPAGPAGARSWKSGPIQITADGRFVWVVNPDNDSVSRITTADRSVDEFLLPASGGAHDPRGLSLLEDGSEVWVACHGSDRVLVLDGATGNVTNEIALPWGTGAHSVAISPDQSVALVSLFRTNALAEIDVATHTVTQQLTGLYRGPLGIAWTADGSQAWISHPFADGEHSRLTQVRATPQGCSVEARISVFATDPRQQSSLAAPFDVAEGGYLTIRAHLAQIPPASGLSEIWLPTQYNNINNDVYTPDSTVQATIRRLDLDTRAIPNTNADKVILSAVHVHDTQSNNAYAGPGWDAHVSGPVDIAFTRNGDTAFIVFEQSNDVIVVPTDTPAVRPANAPRLTEIDVGDRPQGIALGPGGIAYVSNRFSRDVSVVDLGARKEIRRLPVTPVTGEPFTAEILTGAKIFHTSDDPRVSGNSKVSCASCHIDGEHDGRQWGFHNLPGRHGERVTTTLRGFGLAFGPKDPVSGLGQVHSSGDRDEVQDFEHTFRGVQMGGTGFLGADAQPDLGAPNAGRSADLDAVATYLLTLPAIARSPHRTADGSLSEAAVRGASFFVGDDPGTFPADAGCASCHVPETGFVDFAFHDVGSQRFDNEQELNHPSRGAFRWKVNTLTLVGVWATAPYSGVTGDAGTIASALSGMQRDTVHGTLAGLTDRQMEDLAAFVASIDGDLTAQAVRDARDTSPPRVVRVEPWALTSVDVFLSETVQRASAEDLANWTVLDQAGQPVTVTAATLHVATGDRVTLTTALQAGTAVTPRTYTVIPGAILDAADTASNGVANALDVVDPGNSHTFEVGDTLTVTLGASGHENVTVTVHDSAMVGSGLSTWNHDHVSLFPTGGNKQNKGFVRFDWRDAFAAATATATAARIESVSIRLTPEIGMTSRIEARRCLRSWSDSTADRDWNSSADGAPTWRAHAHPDGLWNQPGAEKRTAGVNGRDPADYDGPNDTAFDPDVVAAMPSVVDPVRIEGDPVRDAFRFWFDHPAVDYGYCLQLPNGGDVSAAFHRTERERGVRGPVLTITYSVAD